MDRSILITDIGSTTTKAILITEKSGNWQITGLANAATTVEKPLENVMAGVLNALEILQPQTDFPLITKNLQTTQKQVNPELKWLSTSSAGGGLQILVIGLTKEDSAASAGRAAYGVGGILLDTVAIDDGRSTVEQMRAIEEKQPDIILMSGGYEGGAYASVLRQAEILSHCEIKPKYSLKEKIPLVYAGNTDAGQAIFNILQDNFEVHLMPNIRPSEAVEITGHVTEIVHELFLNKVMQQAPGYKEVSNQVTEPIIPTPLGVMDALRLIAETEQKNILAVDIGGATTDVYSNIFGQFYRTVSANYGMSYNLCNVFAKADRKQLAQWLHPSLPEAELRNYLGNKMLNPTLNPPDDNTLHIEQAMARLALQLSLQQHLQMNFNIERIGHFLRIKSDELDPFHEQFFRERLNEKKAFRLTDFHVIIGAGGVISHAPKPLQAAIMLIDGLQPRGITELWRDRHFISPHLGKLSQKNKDAAVQLLKTECLQPLCLCIRPLPQKLRAHKPALSIELDSGKGSQFYNVEGNKLLWIDNARHLKVKVKCHSSVLLGDEVKELAAETDMPILVDTRISGQYAFAELNKVLSLYDNLQTDSAADIFFRQVTDTATLVETKQRRTFSLPYAGRIYVSEGERVNPDTLLGENLYDPAHVYVLQVFRGRENLYKEDTFRKMLTVKAGDTVNPGQLLYKEDMSFIQSLVSTSSFSFHSPVRGRVEKIDWKNGTLLLREIQDYSFEPTVVKIAEKLGIKPSHMPGSLRKRKGEFVTSGELLAVRNPSNFDQMLHSPATGTIIDIDSAQGTLTIQYQRTNLKLRSYMNAIVTSIAKNRFVELEYEGMNIDCSIGFGKMTDGTVIWNDEFKESELKREFIAAYPFALNREQLELVALNNLAGIVVPSLQEEDIVNLLEYELGVGITGGEDLPFSILLTNGFGKMAFSPKIAAALRNCTGKHGVILPATQIRAGVVRPSLIIQ